MEAPHSWVDSSRGECQSLSQLGGELVHTVLLEAEVLPYYLQGENQLPAFLIMMCLVTQSRRLTTVVYHLVLSLMGTLQ